ncbi:MAG: Mur ligase family protein, partial [Lachnospiraceae bacterium]
MERFCVRDILEATGGKLLCGDENMEIVNFATNSSKSAPGLMFAPIIGERVDGHRYITGAFECGASGTLTQRAEAADEVIDRWKKNNEQPKPVILVNDSIEAMQKTARLYEGRLHLKKAGVTGSVGKTTTKEMIACALSGGLKVFKTAGNANSQIGVPVTLMNISSQDEAAVIEMGMSEEGEMKRLATLLTLDTVVITNIGVSHIEQLGTQE